MVNIVDSHDTNFSLIRSKNLLIQMKQNFLYFAIFVLIINVKISVIYNVFTNYF